MESSTKNIVFVGGGQSNIKALKMVAKKITSPNIQLFLISDRPFSYYYGTMNDTIASNNKN